MSANVLRMLAPAGTSTTTLDAASSASGGNLNLAALALWYGERSALLSSPLKWSADGDYSEDNTATAKLIQEHIDRLEEKVGLADPTGLPKLQSAKLTRSGREGLFMGSDTETSTSSTSVSTETTELLEALDAIMAAAAATVPISVNYNIDLNGTDDVITDVSESLSTITDVKVRDSDGIVITASVSVTSAHPNVTVGSAIAHAGVTVTVTGLPAV